MLTFISNFFRLLNRRLNQFLTIFGLRRRARYWGTVYDSVAKQPLDPAVVKLIQANDGGEVSTCVTDLAGHYSFLAAPGRYKLFVRKSNYQFPSQIITGSEDNVFSNLYHGEFFDVLEDSDVVSFNIPMDPLQADWNQKAKVKVVKFSPFLEHLINRLAIILFWFVFILAAIYLIASRTLLVEAVLAFYCLVLLMALLLPSPRLWGRIKATRMKGQALSGSIELAHREIPDIVVAKSVICDDGKFFLRFGPGKYLLKIKLQASDGQKVLEKTVKIKIGRDGVVNKTIVIRGA